MELTRKQEQGLKLAVERYKNGSPYTCISGYAGSGKSTLIKFIVAALGVNPDKIAYVAYTGKAANVLKQKGCPNATTAHKLLYEAKPKPDGTFFYMPRTGLRDFYDLVVVDEISMLPSTLWDLLLTHRIYVLACGDPGQLPPINPDENNHVLDEPHIFLDEIMRQAQDSEIIRLSMHVREGKDISSFDCANEQIHIYDKDEVVTGMFTWADQILCATNATRNSINNSVRKKLGYGETPVIGDKIIGLTNHWDFFSDKNTALTNGSIGYIQSLDDDELIIPYWLRNIKTKTAKILRTTMRTEDDEIFYYMPIDYKSITEGEKTFTSKEEYTISKMKPTLYVPFDFAYGYAITVWKAQGSEWNKVMLYEEGHPYKKDEHIKYLYTGITRASDKLILIKK